MKHDEKREELLALLEDGPKPTTQLAAWLQLTPMATLNRLTAAERDGAVKRIGTNNRTRWVLAGYIENVVVEPSKAQKPEVLDEDEAIDRCLDDLEEQADADVDVDELPQPPRPVKTPKKKPELQQRFKSAVPIGEPPWWATAPRDGFTAACTVNAERMRNAKEARWVHGFVND